MTMELKEKTFVLTGATSGIGLAVANLLAERGAFLIGVGRSTARCAEVESHLRSTHPHAQIEYCVADLSLQEQVRRLAEEIRLKLQSHQAKTLEGLINNAGTFTYQISLTSEMFEMQWAVNHLAPFLLTHELLSLLRAAPGGRVVTVSSGSHYNTRLKWKDLQLKNGYNPLLAYKQSKLANVLFTAELNRRLGNQFSSAGFRSRSRSGLHRPGLERQSRSGTLDLGSSPAQRGHAGAVCPGSGFSRCGTIHSKFL